MWYFFSTEAENIGRWKCSQHAHTPCINIGEKWPCCGKEFNSYPHFQKDGCVKSDHTIECCPYNDYSIIPLPKYVAKSIGIQNNLPSYNKTWIRI